MDLSQIGFSDRYKRRTGFDLLKEFYIPALENSTTYDRIAGYFSSAVLTEASSGFAKFCSSENTRHPIPKFRLIVGARLDENDEGTILHINEVDAIISGAIIEKINNIIEEKEYDFSKDRISGLAWMIHNGLLEIKVGIRFDTETNRIKSHSEAEFHSKVGIMSDGTNKMSFEGSVNETKRGWVENYESLVVFRSWENEGNRVGHHQEDFDELWDSEGLNSELGVGVYSFPEAARKELLEKFPPRKPDNIDEIDWAQKRREYLISVREMGKRWKQKPKRDKPIIPPERKIPIPDNKWSHQIDAMNWFLNNNHANGVGIFQMATGSGKTRTSISTVKEAISRNSVNKAIFCVPKTLEEQWVKELAEHYPERKGTFWWRSGQDEHLSFFNLDMEGSVMIVSHYFIPKLLEFANKKPKQVRNTILVVDEMHHLGSDKYINIGIEDHDVEKTNIGFLPKLFEPFLLRLGLSATPWSEYDDGRNQMIVDNFVNAKLNLSDIGGNWRDVLIKEKHVFNFGIEDGIKKGILCEFNYVSLEYTPSAEDFQKRKEAYKKIPPNIPKHMRAKMGMILAAQVFKSSREKFPPFNKWLMEKGKLQRCILFVSDKEFGRELTQELSSKHNIFHFREFFEGEDFATLTRFALGELELLIACHRISEGVDIKTVDTVVLFSSNASPLETIQRIGRALRTSQENPDKRALIIDFIYMSGGDSADNSRKEWLEKLSKTRRD
jgi:superfamily II DNA or RNA helicase